MAAELLAPDAMTDDARAYANRVGTAIRQIEMLRDVRQDAYEGRLYVPLDVLDEHSLRLEHLREREFAPQLKQALSAFGSAIRADLDQSVPPRGARLRPLAVLMALHRRLLDRIAARDYDVAKERIDLGPVEKPWVAWKTARAFK
jgi:phytoene synthase